MDAAGTAAAGCSEGEKKKPPEERVKRKMKTASQLEILEKTYAVETYPSEALRADLSAQLGLSDRQLQMWFCHRRLKDRKPPPPKRPRKESSPAATIGQEMVAGEVGNEHVSGSGSGSSAFGHGDSQQRVAVAHRVATGSAIARPGPDMPSSAVARLGMDMSGGAAPRLGADIMPNPAFARLGADMPNSAFARLGADMPAVKRYYEPPQAISELRAISFVEAQLGESLREDGPILGMEFDPLPPGAFGAPIVTTGQQKSAGRLYETKLYERPDAKSAKASSRALQEYQFLPEQPSVRNDSYERATSSHYYSSPADVVSSRTTPLSTARSFSQAIDQIPSGYGFEATLNLVPLQGRQAAHVLPPASADYDRVPVARKSSIVNVTVDPQSGVTHPIIAMDNPFVPLDRPVTTHDEEILRLERKRKLLQSEEARIAKEVEAHEKRIRKELEKQDILRRKREEQSKKEMERLDRERKKEEERLLREKLREEERYQREQKREMERREKFLQKESMRAEKLRIKEEMRREKEAARLKAANERATARRIAKESTELIDDERVELMDLAAAKLGLPSVLSLDSETLQDLDSFRDMLSEFPPKSVRLKMPFTIQPWINSEENTGNLFMVWRFLITFADVLGLWPFTLDEFIQSLHDYDSRLLGEIHVALLRSIIKDIEDVARTPSPAVLGTNQHSAANLGGGHPHIVEGAYAWGFDIRSWQHHLNPLTWPEILRQFALSAGFGPKLKKRNAESPSVRNENEGNDGKDVISTLRNGAAAENALALMQERGLSNPRRSRHRLTPGTVKYAAFHVLSLEGSKGLTILEVADKIQKSGLRDLTTSKTPEASIAAALSRDTKLFERTAPSTYCVRMPYRKDPVDTEMILSEAREKIQVFKNGIFEGEDVDDVEREDVERDEDSDSDVAEDLETDQNTLKPKKEENIISPEKDTVGRNGGGVEEVKHSFDEEKVEECSAVNFEAEEGGVIDESDSGEIWVHALTEGEYSDLSVEERINALVAIIGIANEGNSVRIVLEERLEAANALKKQMWAEAQVDKRRLKDEYITKFQYTPSSITKPDPAAVDFGKSPSLAVDDKLEPFEGDPHNDVSLVGPIDNNDNITPSQLSSGYAAERRRSELKSYIGYKAEEMYVYRSLPLGQDRRRNRYWQFITSSSRNDPGSGRIFVELRNGFWRLIDSEESFDALLSSLDVRGVRESNLLSMMQRVESSFKEAIRKKTESIRIRDFASFSITPDSPKSTICVSNSNTPESSSPPSPSFSISLGRTSREKNEELRRYQDFEKWMSGECNSSSILCALKYGEKRSRQLLGVCGLCHDLYLFEQVHCPLCHRTYDSHESEFNFHEHVTQCTTMESNVFSPDPLRLRMLKSQLFSVEVCIPAEALQYSWSWEFRESWGLKLRNATSAEDVLQNLTLLESAIKKEFLSEDFETTDELLNSSNPTLYNKPSSSSSIHVLPWLPKTTASVALRLVEFDSSIFYSPLQKEDSQKDKPSLDLEVSTPVLKIIPDFKQNEAPIEQAGEPLVDTGGRGRGRGRGGRGRGGRPPKQVVHAVDDLKPRQLVGWKGRGARGRGGRKRGRRTVKTQQKLTRQVAEIAKATEFDTSSLQAEWNEEEESRLLAEEENNSSEQSEYDEDDVGVAGGHAYQDLVPEVGYPGNVYGSRPEYLMEGVSYDDEDEDDIANNDVEGEDFEDDEQVNVEGYFNGDSDEEMREEEDQVGNPDEVTASSSSDYSQ